VKHFVRDNRSQFIVDCDEHDDEDDKKTLTRTVKRLALVGETSIAHTLFTQPERVAGSNIPNQFLELMDYMIANRYSQSDKERAGRNMTLSKTLMRSSLADKIFAMLVWVSLTRRLPISWTCPCSSGSGRCMATRARCTIRSGKTPSGVCSPA